MSDIAIRVENLSKLYRIGAPQARYRTRRDTLAGAGAAPGPIVLVSVLVAVGLLVSRAYDFRRMERTSADVV
jgi:hypothetical protein